MKLSELTYDYLQKVNLGRCYMPTDQSDALRLVASEAGLEDVKQKLIEKWGDMEVEVKPDANWFDRVTIKNEAFNAAQEEYCRRKAAWCAKYGCD